MSRPLSVGQLWLLEHMVSHNGLLYIGLATWHCPEPVGMNTLRGLEKRGLCNQTTTHGIFSITDAGRQWYEEGKLRLQDAIAQKRERDLVSIEENDREAT